MNAAAPPNSTMRDGGGSCGGCHAGANGIAVAISGPSGVPETSTPARHRPASPQHESRVCRRTEAHRERVLGRAGAAPL
jgi:hypothetical protein